MNHKPHDSPVHHRGKLQGSKRLHDPAATLALLAALFVMPAFAEEVSEASQASQLTEVNEVARHNAVNTAQESILWMSGGIGDDAREEMLRAAPAYNVHLTFSDTQGHYLAGIPFSVSTRSGRKIFTAVSEGPLLYLKLPVGAYYIAAEIDQTWQSRLIRVGKAGSQVKAVFIGKGE